MTFTRRLAAAGLAVALGGAGALIGGAAAQAAPGPRTAYVDCSAATDGDGSRARPWNDLAQPNTVVFGPGDRLLFKRGSTCHGMLSPHGSGDAHHPFTIADYGNSRARAHIAGDGAPAAVKLFNDEHVTLADLEITNATAPASQRRGVLVQREDSGTGHGYVVRDLYIHDVLGGDLKGPNGSQGIAFQVTGSTVPTRFDDVHVTGNTLEHIDRQGIVIVLSSWSSRPEVVNTLGDNWLPSTGVVVERNVLRDLGGDGIVLNTTDGAVAQRNTVAGFNRRSAGYNAGIWDYNTDNSLFQYNDVSGGFGHLDGMAYDVDQGNIGTTFQYNYSHDNEGGFFLLCNNGPGLIRDAVVRYNLSVDDAFRGIENCRGAIESASFHHNVEYIGDGIDQTVVNENTTSLRTVDYHDNAVVKAGSGTAGFHLMSGGYAFARNIFVNVQDAPAQAGTGVRAASPAVAALPRPGDAAGLRALFGADAHRTVRAGSALVR